MCYKEVQYDCKSSATFNNDKDEELEFDEKTFLDNELDSEEKCSYFIMCKKDINNISLMTNACSYFWNILDDYYDAAVCLLEIMDYIPVETIGAMFGFDEIAKKISLNPCDVSAAISLRIYPCCGISSFDLSDVIYGAHVETGDVWLRLLIQQKKTYISQIDLTMLISLGDIEDKSYNYKSSLNDLYIHYSREFPELIELAYKLRKEILLIN